MTTQGTDKKEKSRHKKKDGPVVQDDRFKHLHTDPRFQRMPRKELKTEIDDRFKSKCPIC